MNLVRWDPFRELEEMSHRLNRMFSREAPRDLVKAADWAPFVDIKETPEEYLIKAELPEVKKEDVKVLIENGVLTMSGERKLEKEEKGKKYHRIERSYGSFLRSFTLPADVDEKKLAAEFKDGVLSLHLPKSPAATPRSVEVKVS